MNIIPKIFIPSALGLIVFAIAFFKYPRWAVAGLIIAKPVIDLTWNYYLMLDINFLKIYAGMFAILGVIYIIYQRVKIFQCPICHVWMLFIILNFISIFVISDKTFLIDKIDYFLRILNGFVALILFAHLFDFEKDKKLILLIFILAGVFPIVLWLSQIFSGNPITSFVGVNDELRRIKGPYHDFVNFSFFALQSIICCLAFLVITNGHKMKNTNTTNKANATNKTNKTNETNTTNKTNKTNETNATNTTNETNVTNTTNTTNTTISLLTKSVLVLMIIIGVIMVYKSYSKSGWVILWLCFFLWFLLRKKIIPTILVIILSILSITINPFARETKSIFQKEIDIIILKSDNWENDTLFMGRFRRWKNGMEEFKSSSLTDKLIGSKKLIYNNKPESDYLRVLWDNGIIGFIVYLILLIQVFYLIIRSYIKNKDPANLLSIFVWLMFVLESIGFYPMLYPSFQWFMWGIVGFVLSARKVRKANPDGKGASHGIEPTAE